MTLRTARRNHGSKRLFKGGRGARTAGSRRVQARAAVRRKFRTGSKTKTKLNQGVHESRAGSESAFTLGRRAKGTIGKLASKTQKLSYIENASLVITQTAGLQAVVDVWTLGSALDLARFMSQTLTQQYGSVTPTGYQTEKIFIKSLSAEYAFNNNTNDQVRIVIYDYIPKKDVYNSTGDASSGPNAWDTGLVHQGLASASSGLIGASPFASEMFCHFFTIKKITNLTLAPGQTHYHRVKFFPNKMVSNEDLQQGNMRFLKGLTLATMVAIYGAPALDGVGGCTTEAIKVLEISKMQAEWSYVPANMSTTQKTNTLATLTSGPILEMVSGISTAFVQV